MTQDSQHKNNGSIEPLSLGPEPKNTEPKSVTDSKSVPDSKARKNELPFGLARFFSWVSLVLVIISSVVLSLFIGNMTTNTLLNSQKNYALLLAGNLNKQIFRRFTLPVVHASGRVALADPDQYRLLDEVVDSLLHGLNIETIRIYDHNFRVTFSTKTEEVRREDLYTSGVPLIFQGASHHFDVLSDISLLRAFFTPHLPEDSFQLRIVYPLSIDRDIRAFSINENDADMVLGALEIVQDVTSHYQMAIGAQRLIMGGFVVSSLILFILLQVVAQQAERVVAERMDRNRQLEAALHQSEKLASMGRMVASIAHEIRNPLGIIRSSAEFLMKREKNADPVSRPILEAIYDESCRLGSTVNDFLDYARPRQPRQDRVDLFSVLHKVMAFLGSALENQGIEVIIDMSDDLMICGDEDLLYRAFYNIIVNAQQAMQEPGRIEIQQQTQDGKLMVSFRDTGPGFPPEDLPKALDPFFTTKDTGTGLGLPIVQSIVTSHGGIMELFNHPDGGAVVRLLFPSSDTDS